MANKPSFAHFILQLGGKQDDSFNDFFVTFTFPKTGLQLIYIEIETYLKNQVAPDYFERETNMHKDIRLVYVWEDVWLTKTHLVQQRIVALLGLNKKLHARQTQVIRIDKQAAFLFLENNHLQGATSAYYKYALMHNNTMVAAATFSKARTMFDGPTYYRSFELERFANLAGFTVVGGLGKLIHHFMQEHHAKHLMTYADNDWGTGESYMKLGFTQQQTLPAQLFYVDQNTMERFFPNRLTIQQLVSPNLIQVYNSGSTKFVLNHHLANG